MGRIIPAIGCAYVSLDCVNIALGDEPQNLFAPDKAWLFWIFALAWVVAAVRVLVDEDL